MVVELSARIQNGITYGTVKNNIMTIDCIIVDEVSMLSWKMFQDIEHVWFLRVASRGIKRS